MKKFRSFFSNLKIKKKIQLFSTASILLLCVIFLSFYGEIAGTTVLRRASLATRGNLERINAYMSGVNLEVSSRLSHLGTSISIQKRLELLQQSSQNQTIWPVQALLQDIQTSEQIESIELYTLDGEFVAGTTENRDTDWRPNAKLLSTICGMPDTNYWYDDEPGEKARTDGMSIYRAICAAPNVPIGVARVRISMSALTNIYNYMGFNTASDIYFFSGRGNLLLPRETRPAVLRVGRDSFEDYLTDAQSRKSAYVFQKQKYLVQDYPLPQYNLYVVSIAAYSRLMEDIRTLQFTILLLGLVCIVVQILFFSFMGTSLSKPIVKLSQKMKQVQEGKLDIRSDNVAKDEIGVLAENFNCMLDRIQQLIIEKETSEKRRHELELISLQTQITPHFLYNSLDSVSALTQLGDMEGAYQMSKALGGFYRGVLSDGRSVISVQEELQMTDSYLRVQSQRYRDGFDYQIHVAPEILQCSIVKLTIQPLVENAIYHGIREVRRRGLLEIIGNVENGEVVLSVRDNGKGMRPEDNPLRECHKKGDLILHRKGYGMYNADQRIKLYFGSAYGLTAESVPGEGTQVDVRLPMRLYKEYGYDFGFDR